MFSYAILVNNEVDEIKKLLEVLYSNKNEDDEIIVLQDDSQSQSIKDIIYNLCQHYKVHRYEKRRLNNDFASHKNYLNSLCSKEWIVNLDADETIDGSFIPNIRELINQNTDIDSIKLPRVNTLNILPDSFIKAQRNLPGYSWIINEHNHINFPDYQERVYKNNGEIRWHGNVHEVLTGQKESSAIPPDYTYNDLFIKHHKNYYKQFLQNYKYLNIIESNRIANLMNLNTIRDYKNVNVSFNHNLYRERILVITNLNDDYDIIELTELLNNIKNSGKQIIWITDNFLLFKTLERLQNDYDIMTVYFLTIESNQYNADFYYKIININDDINVLSYTININNKIHFIKNIFDLSSDFVII